VDAPGKDGNSSMPEQVKRPNPWRKMMMMMMINMATERICDVLSHIFSQDRNFGSENYFPEAVTTTTTAAAT